MSSDKTLLVHSTCSNYLEKVVLKKKQYFTSVIDEEFPDLCLKTGVPFPLTVLPPSPPSVLPSNHVY
jgi:hypothetical protein